MDKRYQVFVSSTLKDLEEERQEVMQAILEMDCFPAGMELFPAANEDQWSLIKKVIDDSDYYIVISAGRYGSLGPDGVGYTEMEYRYALDRGIPILGFLHQAPDDLPGTRLETTDQGKEKLIAFRHLLQQKPCRFWTSPADLGSKVSRSLVKLTKSEPAVGWVRADRLPSEDVTRDNLRLRLRVEDLESALAAATLRAPAGAEDLAQAEDLLEIKIDVPGTIDKGDGTGATELGFYFVDTTWNEAFAAIAPLMIDEANESELKRALLHFLHQLALEDLENDDEIKDFDPDIDMWDVFDESFQTIKVQLRALGYIKQSEKPKSLKLSGTYWTLTPLGDQQMTRLRAVRRRVQGGRPEVFP